MDINNNETTATEAVATATKNPSAEQVAAWKKEHGKVKLVTVDDLEIYFKQPSRQQVAAANQVLVKTRDASKYADIILKNCQLNYIEETAADDEIYFALSAKVDEIITSKVANLKN